MNRWSRMLLALALAATMAPPGWSQPGTEHPAGLGWLVGSWRGEGRRMNETLEATLEVMPVLEGAFLEFRYRSGAFEGRAFYRPGGDGRWLGHWFDNRGISFGIEAACAGRTLTADWGSNGAERGRTVYALTADGRLEIIDSVAGEDGSLRQFAVHRLQRMP